MTTQATQPPEQLVYAAYDVRSWYAHAEEIWEGRGSPSPWSRWWRPR
jgi:hypothetical protein